MNNRDQHGLVKQAGPVLGRILGGTARYGTRLGRDAIRLRDILKPAGGWVSKSNPASRAGSVKDLLSNFKSALTPTRRLSRFNPIRRLDPNKFSSPLSKAIVRPIHYGLGSGWKSPVGRLAGLTGLGYMANEGYQFTKNLPGLLAGEIQSESGISDEYRDNIAQSIRERWPSLLGQALDPSVYFGDSPLDKAKASQNRLMLRLGMNSLTNADEPLNAGGLGQVLRGPFGAPAMASASAIGNSILESNASSSPLTAADIHDLLDEIDRMKREDLRTNSYQLDTPFANAIADASLRTHGGKYGVSSLDAANIGVGDDATAGDVTRNVAGVAVDAKDYYEQNWKQ